jgi:hypothetical protein
MEKIRLEGDLSPYTSGTPDLEPRDRVTHEVREMLAYVRHYDRVLWAIRTRMGRVIVVMQQASEVDREMVGGQVEIINAPFRDTAVKGLEEGIAGLAYVMEQVSLKARGI